MAAHLDEDRVVWVVPGVSQRVGDGLVTEPDRLVMTDRTGLSLAESSLPAGGWVASVAAGPDLVVVALGKLGQIVACDARLRRRWTVPYPAGRVAVTPDGAHVVALAAFRKEIRLLNAQTGRPLWVQPVPHGVPSGVVVLPDGRLIHGDTGGFVTVRLLATGDMVASRRALPEHVVDLAVDGDHLLVTGLRGEVVRVPLGLGG
jgi:hypothetical protein